MNPHKRSLVKNSIAQLNFALSDVFLSAKRDPFVAEGENYLKTSDHFMCFLPLSLSLFTSIGENPINV